MNITFMDVYLHPSAAETLFDLLQRRTATEAISHAAPPSFDKHLEFFNSRPYLHWYFVEVNGALAGTLYVTDENTIGLSIADQFTSLRPAILRKAITEHEPLPAIPSKRVGRFAINVSPRNNDLIADVIAAGGAHVQNTYLLE